jgi:glycosyltransferase involved in cell wall biosynthesis
MPSFYVAANALLVSLKKDPTFSLTIPGKVQSYLLAGRPIVGMLDGEGADVIKRAQAGLVCPAGDGAALAATVERLAALPSETRERMGANGQAFARAEFDRSTQVRRLLSLLEEARQLHGRSGTGKVDA